MKWCRCGQRPPDPGSDFCSVCRKKMREQAQAQDGDESKRGSEGSGDGMMAVAVGCFSIVLLFGLILGWLVRGFAGV